MRDTHSLTVLILIILEQKQPRSPADITIFHLTSVLNILKSSLEKGWKGGAGVVIFSPVAFKLQNLLLRAGWTHRSVWSPVLKSKTGSSDCL